MRRNGFTLIETMLYIAIIGLLIATFVPFMLQIIKGNKKSLVFQDVSATARYISERIKFEIRNANDINTASSTFGVNLATSTGAMLVLLEDLPNNPTVFEVASGTLLLRQGSQSSNTINANSTKIDELTFSSHASGDGKSHNIGFVLKVSSVYNGAQEYRASATIKAAAELRSN